MPDISSSDPETVPQTPLISSVSGGVAIDAQRDITIGGDVVGRDKIVGYSAEQVSSLLAQISSAFQPRPFDGRCPYLGLDAFSEDDADRFFGRETLVGELVVRVEESRFLIIAGPSGSGKSSLLRAGLIHALKQGALPTNFQRRRTRRVSEPAHPRRDNRKWARDATVCTAVGLRVELRDVSPLERLAQPAIHAGRRDAASGTINRAIFKARRVVF